MRFRVLLVTDSDLEPSLFGANWERADIHTVPASYEELFNIVDAPASADTVFDAIAISCTGDRERTYVNAGDEPANNALILAERIRRLPPETAMFDGRKWSAIPLIVLCPVDTSSAVRELLDRRSHGTLDDVVIEESNYASNLGAEAILDEIHRYRQKLISAFDDMGFLVRYEAGRYVLGPAYKPRKELEDQYYFGPSDRRPRGFTTLHKDHLGLEIEVDQFEALINRKDVREHELQQFFEEHPHFLSTMHIPLPHVRIRSRSGEVFIPDFVLKPIVAQRRDSRWQVLELKLPQEKVLVRRASRRQLSAAVMAAINQLRSYQEHLARADAEEVARVLGYPVRRPRLGVLIGRLANAEVEALDEQQRYQADVTIVTYDEILEERVAKIFV